MTPHTDQFDVNAESGEAALAALAKLRRALEFDMQVSSYRILAPPAKTIAFVGKVRGDAQQAFEHISSRLSDLGYTGWLRERDGRHELVVTQGVAEERKARPWLNVLLFIATLTSLLYVGAGYALTDAGLLEVVSPEQAIWFVIRHIHYGVPFALTLMSILLAHEFSHYFVSLQHGAPTSLPYFIPLPVSPFGTMGALIVQNSPMRDRRALVEIGAAGPIGGLVVAIPLLILGLTLSQVGEPPPGVEVAVQEGNSLLYLGLKYLVYGRILPSGGEDVWLNSVAFAAWAGLFVTMFNLLPIGQLDGGHVARGLLGERAKTLGHVIIGAVLIWGVWLLLQGNQGGQIWLTWGVLNLLLNREHPPLLNELTRLTPTHTVLGLVTLFLFIITFMPAPWQTITF